MKYFLEFVPYDGSLESSNIILWEDNDSKLVLSQDKKEGKRTNYGFDSQNGYINKMVSIHELFWKRDMRTHIFI